MLRIKMMLEEFTEWGSVFLSLSIVNIPGEFDESLSWPFTEKIHVAMINQNPYKALTITDDCELGIMFPSANVLYNRSYVVKMLFSPRQSKEEDTVQPS